MLCQFPDGSVIVSDLLKTHEKDGVVSEGAWRRVDVVVLTLSVRMQSLTDALVKDQSGQDLIEYALVVALIALAATAGMGVVASSIKTAFNHIGSHLSSYTT
jgi:pilus assembly protein Flp/PilA